MGGGGWCRQSQSKGRRRPTRQRAASLDPSTYLYQWLPFIGRETHADTGKQADNELSDKNVFQISNYGDSREVPQSCWQDHLFPLWMPKKKKKKNSNCCRITPINGAFSKLFAFIAEKSKKNFMHLTKLMSKGHSELNEVLKLNGVVPKQRLLTNCFACKLENKFWILITYLTMYVRYLF